MLSRFIQWANTAAPPSGDSRERPP